MAILHIFIHTVAIPIIGAACFLVTGILVIAIIFRFYNKGSFKRCTSLVTLEGKTVIVTGSSAGIGKEAAKDFARRNAKVILACRNVPKAERVAEEIIEATGNKHIIVHQVDTSSLASVRSFADTILKTEKRLDILALNAGIAGHHKFTLTEDGLEKIMATNHFGHILMVNLLQDLLVKSSPSRIVITSSQMHEFIKAFDPKQLNFKNIPYGSIKAYCLSKFCNILMTKYLAAHLCDKGVIVNCFCPGLSATDIFPKKFEFTPSYFLYLISPIAAKTSEEGAQTLIHLAVSEEVADVSGAYYRNCKVQKYNELCDDAGNLKVFWEKSEELVALNAVDEKKYLN